MKQPWEQSNYPRLSPGGRNEGWTHLGCLEGSIAVLAGDTFSPIVTSPPVALNLTEPPTTRTTVRCAPLGHPQKVRLVGEGQYSVCLKHGVHVNEVHD